MSQTMTGALTRAKARVGKPNRVGYCLEECVVNIYQIPGPWRWGGNGRPWALNFWLSAVAHGKVVKTSNAADVPAGAMVFWDTHYGHVAIGAGSGFVYSTDRPVNGRWGRVSINSISAAWGKHLLGYILVTGDGVDLRDRVTAPPPAPKPVPPVDPAASVKVVTIEQNMAGNNAHGIATAKSRVAKFTAKAKASPADVILALETTVASTVRPRLDSGLKPLYRRAGGGEGRYAYTSPRLKILGAGMVTTPKSTWYRNDDKQAAWVAFEIDGARGFDMGFHAESDSGTLPDKLRVDQVLWFARRGLEIAAMFGAPEENVLIAGDTNSQAAVLAAMVAAGWRNVAAGTTFEKTHTFMDWNGKARARFDYGFVRQSALPAELMNVTHDTGIADHAGLRIVRYLTKATS